MRKEDGREKVGKRERREWEHGRGIGSTAGKEQQGSKPFHRQKSGGKNPSLRLGRHVFQFCIFCTWYYPGNMRDLVEIKYFGKYSASFY